MPQCYLYKYNCWKPLWHKWNANIFSFMRGGRYHRVSYWYYSRGFPSFSHIINCISIFYGDNFVDLYIFFKFKPCKVGRVPLSATDNSFRHISVFPLPNQYSSVVFFLNNVVIVICECWNSLFHHIITFSCFNMTHQL